jgi:hypothetical protein
MTISSQNLPSVIAPRSLTIADLNVTINHEPRILDLKLGEMLGFAKPVKIRELIIRHKEALERFGTIPTVGTVKRGQKTTEYYLSKKQALYICTKSETPLATAVTIRMVEVFDEYVENKVKTLTSRLKLPKEAVDAYDMAYARFDHLKMLVEGKAGGNPYWKQIIAEAIKVTEEANHAVGKYIYQNS